MAGFQSLERLETVDGGGGQRGRQQSRQKKGGKTAAQFHKATVV